MLKLGGIVAYRRGDLATVRKRFEQARKLNAVDCEVWFNLGNIHAEERRWAQTIETFAGTASCLESAHAALADEIRDIEASDRVPEMKAKQVTRRKGLMATAGRMLGTSYFNSAAAHFNLGQRDQARRFAELILEAGEDERLRERARELLGRIRK